jgi:general secretion pathway protein J
MTGFTLLEILVALFIFTIIAVIMTRVLHTAIDTQSVTEQHAARLQKLQMALLLFSRDVEQMIDRPIQNAERRSEPALLGSDKDLQFTHAGFANPAGQAQTSTLQRTRYQLIGHDLVRQTWEVLDQTATSKPVNRILLHEVNALRFDYLDQEQHYNTHWPPPNKPKAPVFPVAVKMSLDLGKWGTLSQLYLIPGSSLAATSH